MTESPEKEWRQLVTEEENRRRKISKNKKGQGLKVEEYGWRKIKRADRVPIM